MDQRRKRKLIYVVTEDWYFWLHRLALARGALAAGYDVIVAARVQAHGDRIRAEGFTLLPLPWRRRGGGIVAELRTLLILWLLFRRERPDIVHSLALKPIIYGGLMARLARVRMRIGTVAGLGYVFTSARMKATLLRRPVVLALRLAMGGACSSVLLENPDDGRVLARDGALDPGQVALVCSCGVDTTRFVPAPEPDGPVVAGMACRLVRDKGIDVAVAAMRALKAAGVPIRFRLAGGIDEGSADGVDRAELEGWIAEGLVEWVGHIDDVVAFWHGCHLALYPSRYGEGVPKTLLEAAACGRPIVTTDMPGCRETLDEGVNGFLVPPDDVEALAERAGRLAADPALRYRMGQAGRAKALAEFADEIVVGKTIAIYQATVPNEP